MDVASFCILSLGNRKVSNNYKNLIIKYEN